MTCDKQKLLSEIRAYKFALVEATLFLDTHPRCRHALEYYEKYRALLEDAKAEYEESYGPLTIMGGSSPDCWSWVETPWPWEYDAGSCLR